MGEMNIDIKPISEMNKEGLGSKINQIFTYDWIISKWYEKLLLIGIIGYGIYSVITGLILPVFRG